MLCWNLWVWLGLGICILQQHKHKYNATLLFLHACRGIASAAFRVIALRMAKSKGRDFEWHIWPLLDEIWNSSDLENKMHALQDMKFPHRPDAYITPISVTIGTVDLVCFINQWCDLLQVLVGLFHNFVSFEVFIWHNRQKWLAFSTVYIIIWTIACKKIFCYFNRLAIWIATYRCRFMYSYYNIATTILIKA